MVLGINIRSMMINEKMKMIVFGIKMRMLVAVNGVRIRTQNIMIDREMRSLILMIMLGIK